MLAAAIALALLGPSSFPAAIKVVHAGPWRVVRRTDRFTGGVSCTVGRPRVTLEGAAMMFDVGRTESPVVVRLDNGPPLTLDANSDLATVRVSPDVALFNPSGGKVALPIARLSAVRRVWIRLGAKAWPMKFEIGGLDAALAAAKSAGCAAMSAAAPRS